MRKLLGTLLLCLSVLVLTGVNASAYLDPSAMTYIIQAVAGVVIAGGAAVVIYWKKIKLFFKKKKQNKNKK